MFSLAHALLMGGGGDDLFEWFSPSVFQISASSPQVPQLRITLTPDGVVRYERRPDGSYNWELVYNGRWLSSLQAAFGNNISLRITNPDASNAGLNWSGEDFNSWMSLNVNRSIIFRNGQQTPATASGILRFEFAFSSNTNVILLDADQSYYNYRAASTGGF